VEQWPLILTLLGLVDPAKSGRRRPGAGFMLPQPAASHGANNDSDHRDSARISDVQILKNGGEQVTKLRGYLPEMWCSTLVSEYFRSDEMRQYCSFIEISSAIY
jgi:hypothetical protein